MSMASGSFLLGRSKRLCLAAASLMRSRSQAARTSQARQLSYSVFRTARLRPYAGKSGSISGGYMRPPSTGIRPQWWLYQAGIIIQKTFIQSEIWAFGGVSVGVVNGCILVVPFHSTPFPIPPSP